MKTPRDPAHIGLFAFAGAVLIIPFFLILIVALVDNNPGPSPYIPSSAIGLMIAALFLVACVALAVVAATIHAKSGKSYLYPVVAILKWETPKKKLRPVDS